MVNIQGVDSVATSLNQCATALFPTPGQRAAEVRFNARGIAGFIRFIEVGNGVQIEADLQGLRSDCFLVVYNYNS